MGQDMKTSSNLGSVILGRVAPSDSCPCVCYSSSNNMLGRNDNRAGKWDICAALKANENPYITESSIKIKTKVYEVIRRHLCHTSDCSITKCNSSSNGTTIWL